MRTSPHPTDPVGDSTKPIDKPSANPLGGPTAEQETQHPLPPR